MGTRKNHKTIKRFRKTRSKRQKGGTPSSPPSIEYMIDAIEEGEEEQVKHLLEMGADVNATEPSSGNTPLIEASASKLPKIVKMLIDKEADVNLKNKKGNTALMEAINCDWVDPEFDKPWYLVEYDITEIMEMLLAAGADVNVVNDDGKTALDIAKETECTKKIQLPLKRHNIEQFIPRHLQTQRDSKKDRTKLTWALREKDVGNRGDGTMPYDLRRKIGEYLGGKRKTRSKRQRGGEDTPTIEEQGLCGDCSICLKPMNNVNVLIATDCNHTFHKDCLRSWCQNQANTKCPLCRKPISNTCTDLSSTNILPRAATATSGAEEAARLFRARGEDILRRYGAEDERRQMIAAERPGVVERPGAGAAARTRVVEREYRERTGHGINPPRSGRPSRRTGGKKRTKKSNRKTRIK